MLYLHSTGARLMLIFFSVFMAYDLWGIPNLYDPQLILNTASTNPLWFFLLDAKLLNEATASATREELLHYIDQRTNEFDTYVSGILKTDPQRGAILLPAKKVVLEGQLAAHKQLITPLSKQLREKLNQIIQQDPLNLFSLDETALQTAQTSIEACIQHRTVLEQRYQELKHIIEQAEKRAPLSHRDVQLLESAKEGIQKRYESFSQALNIAKLFLNPTTYDAQRLQANHIIAHKQNKFWAFKLSATLVDQLSEATSPSQRKELVENINRLTDRALIEFQLQLNDPQAKPHDKQVYLLAKDLILSARQSLSQALHTTLDRNQLKWLTNISQADPLEKGYELLQKKLHIPS